MRVPDGKPKYCYNLVGVRRNPCLRLGTRPVYSGQGGRRTPTCNPPRLSEAARGRLRRARLALRSAGSDQRVTVRVAETELLL